MLYETIYILLARVNVSLIWVFKCLIMHFKVRNAVNKKQI